MTSQQHWSFMTGIWMEKPVNAMEERNLPSTYPSMLLCCSWMDIGDCGSQRACSKTYLTLARPDPRCRLTTQVMNLDKWTIVLGCPSRQIYCFLAHGKLTRRNFAVG